MTDDLPPPIPHRRAWVAATTAFLAHNIEEVALDLPAWSETHPVLQWLGWMATPGAFTIAAGILSLAVGALALYAIATGPRWSRAALVIFAVIMLINAGSHIALSLMSGSTMPGVFTAAVLVAPVMTSVLWAARRA